MNSNNLKNTTYDFPLADGTTVKTSIAFYLLYGLKSKNEGLYKRFNKLLQNMDKDNIDLVDMASIVYVAYVCAHLNDENIMTEEEFMIACGSNIPAVTKAVNSLIRPK